MEGRIEEYLYFLMTGGAGFTGSHLVDRLLSLEFWTITILSEWKVFRVTRM